jgi:hypothetical protein
MPKYRQERAIYGLHLDIFECEDIKQHYQVARAGSDNSIRLP